LVKGSGTSISFPGSMGKYSKFMAKPMGVSCKLEELLKISWKGSIFETKELLPSNQFVV
jgi:hypothetical protein